MSARENSAQDGFQAVMGGRRGSDTGDLTTAPKVYDASWQRASGAGAGAAIIIAHHEKDALRILHDSMNDYQEPIPERVQFTEVCMATQGTMPQAWMQVYGHE
jgi:hypothetical protein